MWTNSAALPTGVCGLPSPKWDGMPGDRRPEKARLGLRSARQAGKQLLHIADALERAGIGLLL